MKFKISPEVIFNEKESEGKTVLIDLSEEKDIYFQLSGVGRDFWKLINKGKTEDEIVSIVCEDYDVKEDKVKSDLEHFIRDLKEKKIIL